MFPRLIDDLENRSTKSFATCERVNSPTKCRSSQVSSSSRYSPHSRTAMSMIGSRNKFTCRSEVTLKILSLLALFNLECCLRPSLNFTLFFYQSPCFSVSCNWFVFNCHSNLTGLCFNEIAISKCLKLSTTPLALPRYFTLSLQFLTITVGFSVCKAPLYHTKHLRGSLRALIKSHNVPLQW